ncbi:nuclear transport factor 2 [Rosa sericea]
MQEAKLANPTLPPSAQLVGNAFVEQYYQVLHHSPELVYKFYQDSSALSRTDINGNMTTVKTMDAIRVKIKSLNYEEYTAEIKTADAQESFEKGVIVLVTGCLTGKDNVGRKFTQTFFLAPQENGYFVLNDVFRYIEDNESSQTNSVPVNTIDESAPEAALIAEPEPAQAPDHLVVEEPATSLDEDPNNDPEVCDPSDNDEGSVIEEEVVIEEPPIQSSESRDLPEVDPIPETQEDAPKKSYASIVKVMKSSVAYSPVRVARVRTVSANTDHPSLGSAKPSPVPEASAPSGDAAPESSNAHEEAEGHSIHVRNLPYDATVEQLEKEFKKFGSIKQDGIQVRSSKQGFCFGFVEFESVSSMQSALEASPIMIGDRQAVIEEKRTTTRVSNGGRGRFSSGRAGFRSDSFRGGRGNYGGSRSFGRNEFRNQGEFSRSKSSAGRNGEGYQRVNPNGRGGGRQGATNNRSSVPT